MAKRFFVYSKLTCDTVYNLPNEKKLKVNGVIKKSTKEIQLDCGITEITEDQFNVLSNLPVEHVFSLQKNNGYLKLDNQVEPEEAVKSMRKRDKSYLTDQDSIKEKVEMIKNMQGSVE